MIRKINYRRLFNVLPGYLFVLPALVLFLVFELYPMIMSFFISLCEYEKTSFVFVGLKNYKTLLNDVVFSKSFLNSVLFVLGDVPLVILFSLFVSFVIYNKGKYFLAFARAAFYIPSVASIVTIGAIWRWMLDPTSGIINHIMGMFGIQPIAWLSDPRYALPVLIVILMTITVGQAIILNISTLQNIPKSYIEAASIDGASSWDLIVKIIIPLMKPTTLFIVVMSTIQAFQTFAIVQLLTAGGPIYSTSTIVFQLYQAAFHHEKYGEASAMGVILGLIVIIISMIIYNFPAFSGVNLNSDNVEEFFCDPRFIGIKHTSSDFFTLERIKQKYDRILVYNGFDEMFLSGLIMGADGGIGSTYNIMAEKFIKMRNLFLEGNIAEAQKIQTEANEIIKVLAKVGVMPGEKEILNMMGLEFGTCRKPFRTLTDEEKKLLKEVCQANGVLE